MKRLFFAILLSVLLPCHGVAKENVFCGLSWGDDLETVKSKLSEKSTLISVTEEKGEPPYLNVFSVYSRGKKNSAVRINCIVRENKLESISVVSNFEGKDGIDNLLLCKMWAEDFFVRPLQKKKSYRQLQSIDNTIEFMSDETYVSILLGRDSPSTALLNISFDPIDKCGNDYFFK